MLEEEVFHPNRLIRLYFLFNHQYYFDQIKLVNLDHPLYMVDLHPFNK